MTGYVRQSAADIVPTAVVRAAPINNEFNTLRDAFEQTAGHKHDGTAAEGHYVPLIADSDARNKVAVDTVNNRVGVFVEVGGAAAEQVRVQDGAIVPVTDNDMDLGTSSLEFKDLYIDGTANIDSLIADTADINAGTIDNTVIGATTAAAATVTTLTSTGSTTLNGTTVPASKTIVVTTDKLSVLAATSSSELAGIISDETGSGALVFANSPTLVTPTLGTPASATLTNATGLPLTSGVTGTLPVANGGTGITSFGTGVASFLGTPTSSNLAAAVTDETGSGALVFATSPTLVTPALGTPSSATLTNATGLPIASGVSGLGTGVASALAVAVGSSGAPVVNGGALGTPSSGVATNITGLPLTSGVTGTLPVANGGTGITSLGTGVATFLGTPSSANLASAVTDETGTGALVFANSPTLVTPTLGTPASATLTNATGLPLSTGVTGTLPIANGGTSATTALGARTALLPSLTGNGGKIVAVNSGATDIEYITVSGTGTVTSLDISGGTTGLTTSGGPVTTAGTITLAGTLAVANGGTGATSLTANNVILGNGTSAVQVVAPGTTGNVLTSNGTTWISSVLSGGLAYTYTTTPVTATNNQGVLADTSGGSFTVTLPATPSVGNQVIIADAGSSWGTNNLTVGRNGSTIGGLAENLVCDLSGVSVQFVYDGTTWEVYAQVGGQGGNAVTLDGVQTLTNKTLTVPKITSAALSTATAGALEYDGKVSYFTPQGTQRGVTPGMQYYRLNSALAGASSTAAQSFLGVGVTLSSSTVYAFDGYFPMSKATGGVAHIVSLLFGGTATINNIGYSVLSASSSSASFTGALGIAIYYLQVATASAITGSGLATNPAIVHAKISGTVSVNAGGTFIPQYQLSAAPGGAWTVASGAYFSIYPISASGSNTSVGDWA